jgi:two-component system, chemotaxis family, CheB/CheR fusion protein
MAFALVQHLDPSHHSLLAQIIAKATKMPVEEVKSGVKIRPNCVYVIPPNAFMAISAGVFTLTPRSKEPGQHLSVNFFMRSLAQERKHKAIGIVLSGTGADGTLGFEDIKAEGGITFAQAPASAKYDGMPRSAIDAGCVDFVLPPKEIAKELQRITRHPYVSQEPEPPEIEPSASGKEDFTRIIGELRKTTGVDFSQYKPNTLHRRAMRRMVILKLDSVSEYAKYLKEHREEAEKFYDDVLIPVTSFFRDFEVFEALKSQVYPAILKDKSNKGTIRMWAPGCSTGEETYSLAMTLLEFLGDATSFQVQIFGTDLSEKGIQKARTGVYPESIAEEISPERMRRFFVKVEEGYRVNKAVRDMCVFARQNLASDPPFSQMNLVACRNLLIYVQPVLQKRIVPILHYALKPSGFLVLGSSESVSAFPDLFSTVDKKHKIYAKKITASRLHYNFAESYYPTGGGTDIPGKTTESQGSPDPEVDVQIEADRLVLKNYAPVGVVIDANMEVVQFRGRTTPYLEQAPGKPSLNVLKLARNGLAIELRSLINAAKRKAATVKKDAVLFDDNSHQRILNISVSALGKKSSAAQEHHFLILFEDVTSHRISGSNDVSREAIKAGTEPRYEFKRLRQELADAQDALRASIESEDALKEEFQSANEEILSANEELQSTNEELETSKEELQSANEELNTLNDELRHKNTELHDLNNDLLNFLNSTKLPVVMLDRNSRIHRLTPNAGALLNAVPSDIGRPIADLRLNLRVPDLETMITRVLDSLQPFQRDVQDLEGHWHSLHILPYKTLDNKIDGVVMVLQDIDAIKSANEQLRKSSEFFRGIINTVREPLLVLDSTFRVIAANESFLQTFGVSPEQTVNKFLYRIGNEQWNITKLRVLLEQVLPKQQAVTNFEIRHKFENIGHRTMLLNAQMLSHANSREPMILLAIEDITERKLAEAALIKSEKLAAAGRLAATLAHEINNPLQAVSNLMNLLEGSEKLDEEDRQHATLAKRELGRVVHLVRQSLGFYRESSSATAVNLEEVLESVLSLYARQIEAKHITVSKQYRVDGTIQSYPGEIRQVFSTLLVNAMEATPKDGRFVLRASTSCDWRNPAIRGMRITLADTGGGISADNAIRIFEPFFTTKGERGTGLGLWVSHGVVHRLGGSIRVRSTTRAGKSGTAFSVFLPHRTRKMDLTPSAIGRLA